MAEPDSLHNKGGPMAAALPEGETMTLKRNWSRRAILRGSAVGLAGLAGAALLGCGGGGDGEGGGSGGSSGGLTAAESGAPKNVTRAEGFDPKLGELPVNTRKVVQGGVFRRQFTDTTREQDPDVSIAGADAEAVMDRLVYANGWTMKITPDMLTSYELVDKQGLEMAFKLRPGIKTHNKAPLNGRIFTAKDVAYSIMRKAGKINPTAAAKYARVAQYDGLDKAEAVDDVTVKLTFSRPNGSIMQALSDPRAQMMPVEMDTVGFKDPMKIFGTGAWIQTEYLDGSRQVFTAFPDYYRSWDEGGRPGFATFEKIVIADRASSLAAYISGQTSIFTGIQPQEEPQIKASAKDSQYLLWPGPTWDHFAVNTTLPQFKDWRIRQAFQLALDYKAINDPLGKGWTYSAGTHSQFPESLSSEEVSKLPGYNQATKQADIAEAVKLMDAAGHKDGSGLKFKQINSGASVSDSNVRVKDQFGKVFPRIEITLGPAPDYASFTNVLNNKDYEARVYNHTSVPDAAIDAVTYHHTKGGRNYQGYSEAWADAILDKLVIAQTLQERRELLRSFVTRYLKEGPPLVLLNTPPENSAVHGDVAGYDLVSGPWAYPSYRVSPRWLWQTEM
jgi:peptide/nickel transport system substrate-binding protein